jgi:hypothetical protein
MNTMRHDFKLKLMIIDSVSNLRTLMEDVFCKIHSSVNIDISRKLAEDWVISIVDTEIEVLEDLVTNAEAVKKIQKDKAEHDEGIMEAYYIGIDVAYRTRIRRYKSRITQLKKIKEVFYAKRL